VEGKLVLATVSDLADQATTMAGQARIATGADRVTFTVPATGLDYIGVFSRFPPSFQKPWEVAIVVPLDDFVGGLKQTNRNFVIVDNRVDRRRSIADHHCGGKDRKADRTRIPGDA